MEQNKLKEFFESVKSNNNFKYLIDDSIITERYQDGMRKLYDEIIYSLKYYKAYYPEFARKMRSICTTVVRKALELFEIESKNIDNTSAQLSQLFNTNTLISNNDVAKFASRLAGIDAKKTIDNFKAGKRTIWLDNSYLKKYHKHDTIDWTSDGSVKRYNIKRFECNNNTNLEKVVNAYENNSDNFYCELFKSINQNAATMQNYILRNMNQKFLSYIIHNTPGVNPFYSGVNVDDEDEQGVNDVATNKRNMNEDIYKESIENPYKFLLSTVEFINDFLIELCSTKFKEINNKKKYNINVDLFSVNNMDILNVLESNNKHYKLLLAKEKKNNDYIYYILQQYEFKELIDEKLFYNTTETANAMANCSGIIDINEVKFGDSKSNKYKIYQIKIGSYSISNEILPIKTLYPDDLKLLTRLEKEIIVKSLYEQLEKIHKKRLFLRFIDADTFIAIKDEDDNIDLKLISIEYSKRKRIESTVTVKNYIPTGGVFGQLDSIIENVDLSINGNALIVDTLYATFMALYILSGYSSIENLKMAAIMEFIRKNNDSQEIKTCLEKIKVQYKELISSLNTNSDFNDLLNKEVELSNTVLNLANYLKR